MTPLWCLNLRYMTVHSEPEALRAPEQPEPAVAGLIVGASVATTETAWFAACLPGDKTPVNIRHITAILIKITPDKIEIATIRPVLLFFGGPPYPLLLYPPYWLYPLNWFGGVYLPSPDPGTLPPILALPPTLSWSAVIVWRILIYRAGVKTVAAAGRSIILIVYISHKNTPN